MAHNTIIGKGIIKSLMFSLYHEPETIYREYLQNAYDSINEAISKDILKDYTEGHVTIKIDEYKGEIIIEDNGIGISVKKAEKTLKNVACSEKKNDTSAGFYGIGRLVGAGYCKQLKFKTSAFGEEVASQIIFDVEKVDNILKDDNDSSSAAEVIDKATTFQTFSEEKEKHYFSVILTDVRPEYQAKLLNEALIRDYLIQVAPIQYSTVFKNNFINRLKEENQQFQSYYSKLNAVCVSINNSVDIRKAYGLNIEGTNDEILGLEFFVLSDNKNNDLAWGWYAITPFSGEITEKNKTRGIRLRVHNIQIGKDDFLNKYFKESRGNHYFNGEIHVVNKNIEPTTDRSGLSPSPETEILEEKLKEFFKKLHDLYRKASTLRSSVGKYQDAVKKIQDIQQTVKLNDEYSESLQELETRKKDAEIKLNEQISKHQKEDTLQGLIAITEHFVSKNNDFNKKSEIGNVKPNVICTSNKKDVLQQKILKESDEQTLIHKYGKENVAMLKRIFQIMNAKFKDNNSIYQQAIKSAQSTIIQELKK